MCSPPWVSCKQEAQQTNRNHQRLAKAIETTITKQENRTKDLGGSAKTNECGDAIMKSI